MLQSIIVFTSNAAVMEAHPEHPHPDLRLTNPFPELVTFCDGIDLESLNKKDHSHVPWLVLVYKYLQIYKTEVCSLCTNNTLLNIS